MVAFVYFPFMIDKYQKLTVDRLMRYYNQGIDIAEDFLEMTGLCMAKKRVLQFVFMVVLQFAFGLTKGGTFSLLTSGNAERVRSYIGQLDEAFPGGSTASKRMGQVLETCGEKVMALAARFQDHLYVSIGAWARGVLSGEFHSSRSKMTPPPECFIGLIAPSETFPHLNAEERGVVLPFFYALIYHQARRISSTAESIGLLKEPSLEMDGLVFRFASKFGFFGGPPGKNKVYGQFKALEGKARWYNAVLNEKMNQLALLDLMVVSIDGTNVPVDKRDQTGSIGTGSCGAFFGQKSSIACDVNCVPLNSTLDTGYCPDVNLLPDTLSPVKALANRTGQEIWTLVLDAAYSNMGVIF